MSQAPNELKYASSHEWARLEEDGTVTVTCVTAVSFRSGLLRISAKKRPAAMRLNNCGPKHRRQPMLVASQLANADNITVTQQKGGCKRKGPRQKESAIHLLARGERVCQ